MRGWGGGYVRDQALPVQKSCVARHVRCSGERVQQGGAVRRVQVDTVKNWAAGDFSRSAEEEEGCRGGTPTFNACRRQIPPCFSRRCQPLQRQSLPASLPQAAVVTRHANGRQRKCT